MRTLWQTILLCCFALQPLLGLADVVPGKVEQPGTLEIVNRTIFVFRSNFLGELPEVRASRARTIINEVLDNDEDPTVSVEAFQQYRIILIGDRRAFIVSDQDIDPVKSETVDDLTRDTAEKLRQVVEENQESRNLRFMSFAAGYSAMATLVFILLIRLVNYLTNRAVDALPLLMQRRAAGIKLGNTQVVEERHLNPVITSFLRTFRGLLILLLAYAWVSFVLSRFPYTRPWGEDLHDYLVAVAAYLFEGIVSAMPGLGVAIAIYLLARTFSGFIQGLLKRMVAPGKSESWLNAETLSPTQRLSSIAIWLFALAMAYPYLPGAGTEAFKGLSVLVGLMISLGASSVIGQAASGLILTYTRTLRSGEYVRVGEHEGTVTDMGLFTTRIRTGTGEVLTIPNSTITGSITKNFSRSVNNGGFVLSTTVTIGYDTPWRQVEAMLLEAAKRTEGVNNNPVPKVFQTALSDYYPEYRLVVQAKPRYPATRASMLSDMHAHIQDVFNEYGVQIMSPHYIADPQVNKVVAKEDWYQPPAQP